jgi:hypothetical protein
LTTLPELMKVFETRKHVAEEKVKIDYRKEHSQGVADAYNEIINDLSRIKPEKQHKY